MPRKFLNGAAAAPPLPVTSGGTGATTVAGILSTLGFGGGPSSGYEILPGGLILQWGTAYNQTQSDYGVGFPTAFPNAAFGVWLTPNVNPGSNLYVAHLNALSKSSFSISCRGQSGGTTSYAAGLYWSWIALGY